MSRRLLALIIVQKEVQDYLKGRTNPMLFARIVAFVLGDEVRVNHFQFIQRTSSDLIRRILVFSQIHIASLRSFAVQLDGFKFVQRFQSLNQSVCCF